MAETPRRAATTAYPAETYPTDHRADRRYDDREEHEVWETRTRVVLSPIAAPSILGLFGFAGATMMVGAWQAGWYGDANTGLLLFPFAAMFGGVAQFAAGIWSYRARDGLATAVHCTWGSFWMAFGLFFGMVAAKVIPTPLVPHFGTANPAFGFWFVVLAVVTGCAAIASLGESLGIFTVLGPLALGSALSAVGWMTGVDWLFTAGGYAFTFAALAAVYVATAMMLEGTMGRTILPLGKYHKSANVPGRQFTHPIEYAHGQPGVKMGQ